MSPVGDKTVHVGGPVPDEERCRLCRAGASYPISGLINQEFWEFLAEVVDRVSDQLFMAIESIEGAGGTRLWSGRDGFVMQRAQWS